MLSIVLGIDIKTRYVKDFYVFSIFCLQSFQNPHNALGQLDPNSIKGSKKWTQHKCTVRATREAAAMRNDHAGVWHRRGIESNKTPSCFPHESHDRANSGPSAPHLVSASSCRVTKFSGATQTFVSAITCICFHLVAVDHWKLALLWSHGTGVMLVEELSIRGSSW